MLVTPEELKSLMYKSRDSEWPGGGVEQECERIIRGWEEVKLLKSPFCFHLT